MPKKVTALPSVVIMEDGSEKELNSFSEKERDEWSNEMCRRMGEAIREQYADNPVGWKEFIAKLRSK